MRKNGAEILIDALIRENVDIIFGYPGGQAIPIFNVLYDTKEIKVVLTRHEQGAAHAAEGYARATGKVGVCLATSGPGATNLVTGIADAYLDSTPLVAITGQVATPYLGTDAFQEVDIVGITRPVTKHNILVKNIKDFPFLIKEAFYIARTGRPGPVLIDIPADISKGFLDDYEYPAEISLRSYRPTTVGHVKQIEKAAALIKTAARPLVFAGGGVISADAHQELFELATKLNAPVTLSLMGLGAFPGEHPLFIGMPGMHGSKTANSALQEADVIISVGVRFDDRVTGHVGAFAPKAKIIHLDIDPATISKIVRVDIPVVGDAKNIVAALVKIVAPRPADAWNDVVNKWKGDTLFAYKNSDKIIKPQFVIEQIYELTKDKDAIITTEVGQTQMWCMQYYKYARPRTCISSGGLGTMGFGLPAAMGASLGRPGALVIDIAGDGSIQMNIQELATISINKIPVKVAIINNEYLGMVRQWQDMFWNKRRSSTCLRGGTLCVECTGSGHCKKPYVPDFVRLAESYDIPGLRATKASEVVPVLQEGLNKEGPVVMEFMVAPEENVYPIVPVGKSLDQAMEEL
ncbi:MAG: biosynthetic-type acetolactate synthase large subunit [Chitinivibrionales bacterium]|nr:biosynthetic-type acetolactate synthase large subunit [Chitinivibrionales bacterium]